MNTKGEKKKTVIGTALVVILLVSLLTVIMPALARDMGNVNIKATEEIVEKAIKSIDNGGIKATSTETIRLISIDRTRLVDDIYEYTIILQVGDGEFDKIGIHRVVKERRRGVPIRTRDAVMMVHGDTSDFDSAFLMSTLSDEVSAEQSIAIYLAQNNIDVWGIDLRWTFVPDTVETLNGELPYCYAADCSFMKDWDTALHIEDTKKAVKIARLIRGLTGSGFDKIYMLGHSRGAQFTYAYANKEAVLPRRSQDLRGIIILDMVYKFDPAHSDLIESACIRHNVLNEMANTGIYFDDTATVLKYIAYMATINPDGHDLDPVLTNYQVAIGALSATHAGMELPPVPFYHYCAGTFNEYGIPTGLQFTNEQYMFDFAFEVPAFQSLGEMIDGEAIWCDDTTPYDDNLNRIRIPVLYIGAEGGFGSYGIYTTTLLGSRDVTTKIISMYPPEARALDYGHIDLLFATEGNGEAKELVWNPVAQWIRER